MKDSELARQGPAQADLGLPERSTSPAVGPGNQDPSPTGVMSAGQAQNLWPPDLTRRLRVLLHTLPLDALRRGDSMRDPELRHYDGLALGLRLLDIVIDRLGLEQEADRESITRVLGPVLAAMDAAADVPVSPERHDRMVDKVLSGMRNDGDARRPFREEYASIEEQGEARRHVLEFRLLADAFHPAGGTVLRPSDEACNLYLRLLDLDIEDAQSAAEAVVESQIARGRFDEAVHSARQARIQSIRFRDKVVQILNDTRRDVQRVDWAEEVPRMLDESLAHLDRRVAVERGILASADERLDRILEDEPAGEQARQAGQERPASRQALAQVAELTRDCLKRHAELHGDLLGARNVFLEAQARQAFAPRPSRPLPDLADEVLEPLLRLPISLADPLLHAGFPALVGPRTPVLAFLPDLVTWMLQPRRPAPRREIPIEPVDATDLEAELRRFPPEVREQAEAVLLSVDGGARLSELLARARTSGASAPVLEVISLVALHGFASEDRASARVASDPVPKGCLEDPLLYGDDLLVSAAKEEP